MEAESGHRLVEDVERLAAGRLESSFESLMRWASPPESVGRRLAKGDVAEADAVERLHLLADGGHGVEEAARRDPAPPCSPRHASRACSRGRSPATRPPAPSLIGARCRRPGHHARCPTRGHAWRWAPSGAGATKYSWPMSSSVSLRSWMKRAGAKGAPQRGQVVLHGILACAPVQFDAHRRGPLDDVEELAEGQRDQPQHDNRLVGQRDEPVVRAVEEGAVGGQRQARSPRWRTAAPAARDRSRSAAMAMQREVVEAAMERHTSPTAAAAP